MKSMDKPMKRLLKRTEKSVQGKHGWTKYLNLSDKTIKAKRKEIDDLKDLRKSLDALEDQYKPLCEELEKVTVSTNRDAAALHWHWPLYTGTAPLPKPASQPCFPTPLPNPARRSTRQRSLKWSRRKRPRWPRRPWPSSKRRAGRDRSRPRCLSHRRRHHPRPSQRRRRP